MLNEIQPWERFSADELAAWVNDMINAILQVY